MLGVAQFTDADGKVVHTKDGVKSRLAAWWKKNTNAVLVRRFRKGVTVPAGAQNIYLSLPDNEHWDNKGKCMLDYEIYNP
ncbi:MAG: hypothetical protein HY537_03985 [Deltaproteobacteria bacterium]|nr:hypothetical protein [Deltaproteobacteria bacterium]